MNRFLKRDNLLHLAFICLEIAILAIILFSDWAKSPFCFSAVALAFLHTAIYFYGKRCGIYILLGMFFTLISDVFLVILFTDSGEYLHQALGMSFFSACQISYFLYLLFTTKGKKTKIVHVIIRAVLSIAVVTLTIVVLGENSNYLAVISLFYYINLILNMVFAFVGKKEHLLFAIGLLMFMFCDIFIGLNAAVGTFIFVPEASFIYALANPSFNFAWLFYVPSQTLISISIALKAKKGE